MATDVNSHNESILSFEQQQNLMHYWGMKSVIDTAVEAKVIELAKSAITEGLDNNVISRLTGLSIEQIENLRT
jgi:hypothetical protein